MKAHFVHFWSFFENLDWDADFWKSRGNVGAIFISTHCGTFCAFLIGFWKSWLRCSCFFFLFFLQIKRFHEIFHQMFRENDNTSPKLILTRTYIIPLWHILCIFDRFLKIVTEMLIFFFLFFADRAFAEKQRYDGWYNNLAHPNWGSAGKSYDLCRYLVSLAEFNENFRCHFSGA